MELAQMKMCAFCVWCTHDFPDNEMYEQLHLNGWHVCALDGRIRKFGEDCESFVIADGVQASF